MGDQRPKILSAAAASLLGGAVAAAAALLILIVCAAAVSLGLLSEKLELQMSIAACLLGAFIGGCVTRRRWSGHPLPAGLSAGGALFLILLTAGLIGFRTIDITSGGALGIAAGCLCGGAIAGLTGKKGRKKKKRRSN